MLFKTIGFSRDDLLSKLSVMVHLMTVDGRIVDVNDLWLRTLGYQARAHELNFFVDVVHSMYRTALEQDLARLQVEPDFVVNRSIVIHGADNREYSVDCTCYLQSAEAEEQILVCALQRRAVEDQPERELERIFQMAHDLLGIADMSGQLTWLNHAWGRVLGYEPAEMLGQPLSQYVHPDDAVRTTQILDAATASDGLQIFENRNRCKDGSFCWLEWSVRTNVETQQFYLAARDITYHKTTEMQLQLRNQAIEASPSGISIADARLPDMPLIYINPAFEVNTGYSVTDAIGRNCRFLQGTDRDQPGVQHIRQAIQQEKNCSVVLRNYRKDGTLFYNELNLAPIHNEHGELTHYVGISTDVTERIVTAEKIQAQNNALLQANSDLALARQQALSAAEQIREQNEQLLIANRDLGKARSVAEEATRLKSQFLATMSHELRTPLNAIIGYTEIQLAGMSGELNEEQRDYQVRVLANAEHLLDLINDVLDLSKIEAGRIEIINKPFEVRSWVQDVVDQTRMLAVDRGLEYTVSFDDRMPERIVGDGARLRQIAVNLLSNAIKFTKEGSVRMLVRKHGPDAWMLIVEDTGIGIPSHLQETIFEEFRQLDSSFQRRAGGTGLGLAIVRKLALMMGGTLRLKSQVNEGSTFTVILPLNDASAEERK
jgi:PAS domain S-box-containing protein